MAAIIVLLIFEQRQRTNDAAEWSTHLMTDMSKVLYPRGT